VSVPVSMWVSVCVSEYVDEWCEWVSMRVSMLVGV